MSKTFISQGIVVSTNNKVSRNEDFWGHRVNITVFQDVLFVRLPFTFAKLSSTI